MLFVNHQPFNPDAPIISMMIAMSIAKDFVDFFPGACPDQFSIVVFLAPDEDSGFIDSGAFVVTNGAGVKFDSLAFQPFVHTFLLLYFSSSSSAISNK